jgi:uncharacterized cysteine cluster protein YcgN (CxxCxxCC family)
MRSALAKLSKAEFEALCDGCAKCCSIGDGVACPGLDTACNRCTVYAKRQVTEMCVRLTPHNILRLHEVGILPDSCAYVRYEQGLPPLDRPVEKARLTPFSAASAEKKEAYTEHKIEWFNRRRK